MLKRPFAYIGISYLVAQLAAVILGNIVAVSMLCITAAALIIYLLFEREKRRSVIAVGCAVICALAVNVAYYFTVVKPSASLEGQTAVITGTVSDEPYTNGGRYYYRIDTEYIGAAGAPQEVSLRLSSKLPLEAEVEDDITAYVLFGQFDSLSASGKMGLLSRNITAIASVSPSNEISVNHNGGGLKRTVINARNSLKKSINSSLESDVAALLIGMLLGDTSSIGTETIDSFRICGMSHLLAVSGVHMAIIASAIVMLLRFFGMGYKQTSLCAIAGVICFMALTGFSASVTRAGIMVCLALLAQALSRQPDSLNSLGISALGSCLISPNAAGNIGLLLSFSATLGIIVFYPKLSAYITGKLHMPKNRRLRGLVMYLISVLAMSVTAGACTFPVSAFCFDEISLIAPLMNLMCMFAATWFILAGGIMAAVGIIPVVGQVTAAIISAAVWVPGKYMLTVTSIMSELPGAAASMSYSFVPYFVCAVLVMVLVWLVLFRKKKRRTFTFSLCAVLIIQILFSGLAAQKIVTLNDKTAVIYNVGDGLGVALISEGRCVVIGTGGDNYLAYQMSRDIASRDISGVDAVFYPDSDMCSASYAAEFIGKFSPRYVFANGGGEYADMLFREAVLKDCAVYRLPGSYAAEGVGCRVAAYCDDAGCVWTYACIDNLSILICPPGGDCKRLPPAMTAPDCAVVLSSDVANIHLVNATATVVSREYDDAAVLKANLQARGAKNVYTTSQGTLEIRSSGNGITVKELPDRFF